MVGVCRVCGIVWCMVCVWYVYGVCVVYVWCVCVPVRRRGGEGVYMCAIIRAGMHNLYLLKTELETQSANKHTHALARTNTHTQTHTQIYIIYFGHYVPL